jgi:hypothetical protein
MLTSNPEIAHAAINPAKEQYKIYSLGDSL